MSASKAVVLQGFPVYNENGVAGASVTPGMLVSGVDTIIPHGVAGGVAARTFALERDELGDTIDDAYATNDVVKVGSFAPGDVVNALLVSGALSAGTFLESNGNGYLKVYGSGVRVGRLVETFGSAGSGRAAVEIY